MKEKNIKLLNVDEVKQFVSAAIQCDFDVDVYYNRVIIDAKSILGVFSLSGCMVRIRSLKSCWIHWYQIEKKQHKSEPWKRKKLTDPEQTEADCFRRIKVSREAGSTGKVLARLFGMY